MAGLKLSRVIAKPKTEVHVVPSTGFETTPERLFIDGPSRHSPCVHRAALSPTRLLLREVPGTKADGPIHRRCVDTSVLELARLEHIGGQGALARQILGHIEHQGDVLPVQGAESAARRRPREGIPPEDLGELRGPFVHRRRHSSHSSPVEEPWGPPRCRGTLIAPHLHHQTPRLLATLASARQLYLVVMNPIGGHSIKGPRRRQRAFKP